MKWKIEKAFSAQISNEIKTFQPGDEINLPIDKAARLLLAGFISAVDLDGAETEYFTLLRHFWEIDMDPAASIDEARRLVVRLDELYQELNKQGRRVPVRLPVRRDQAATQAATL